MKNEIILRNFMRTVWNEKDFASIVEFVDPKYTIHLDTDDPWEGKILNQCIKTFGSTIYHFQEWKLLATGRCSTK